MAQEKVGLIETVLFSGFAGVGGILAYCLREVSEGQKPQFKRALIEGFSSAFVGVIAMMACKALGLDWYWSGVVVGVFGWLGANASIALLAKAVKARLGIKE